jgi:hypothetical protein
VKTKIKKVFIVALLLLINPHRVICLVFVDLVAMLFSWLSDKLYNASEAMDNFSQEKHVNWPLFGAKKLGFKKMIADIDKERSRQAADAIMPKVGNK